MQPSPQPGAFAPTRWTLVLRARGVSPEARAALGDLCEAYWTPVFRFLRSEGRDEDTARELTQEFFARLLEHHGLDTIDPGRGRFRSFLLGAVKHFLADMRDHERCLKRGGGQAAEPLPNEMDTSPGVQIADPNAAVPDAVFDRQWALALMDRALFAVNDEFKRAGKQDHFETLKPWLVGETDALSQADAARQLGLNEGAVKVAIHRLRKRFRDAVRTEIAQTVEGEAQVDEELRYLIEVLAAV